MQMNHRSRYLTGTLATFALAAFLGGCGSSSTDGTGSGSNPPNPLGAGPAPVSLGGATDLGGAGAYAVLAKSGVTNAIGSTINGNVGVSPAAASYITGFALVADASNTFSTSPSVVGNVYAANYAIPTPAHLTSAIARMETAYTDAAGRTSPDFNELGGGALGGLTLVPGLYKWTTSVTIPTNTTLSGGANDVWIFQISGDLTIAAAKRVLMAGGARAGNVFWQVAGQATLGTTSHFEGTILSKTGITLNTGASMNGRALAQTLVALDNNVVTGP
jgi:hypothetical protein